MCIMLASKTRRGGAGAQLASLPSQRTRAPPHARAQGIAYRQGSLFILSLDPYKSCKLYRLDNVDLFALNRQVSSRLGGRACCASPPPLAPPPHSPPAPSPPHTPDRPPVRKTWC